MALSAIRTYGEARTVYQAIRDPEGEADQLDEIGRETFGLGQYRDAKAIWEQAYDLHIVSGDSGDAGYSQSQIGQAAWNLGDYQGAIAAHTRATQLRRQAGRRVRR